MKQILLYVLLTALVLFLLIRGIIPAMVSVGTDFPNYYTSARLLVEGKDVSRLYDDNWFQEQIHGYGMNQLGKFSPFPPMTAVVMTPLVFFSPENALRLWTVINLVLLAVAIVLVSRIANQSLLWGAFLFLLSGHALANNFRFGQVYLILTILVMLGYRYWINGEQKKTGLLLGLGAAIKYFPILFVVEFVARREWKTVFFAALTVILVSAIGIVVLGPSVNGQFALNVLGHHLQGDIQNPFSPIFQSWNSLFRRWFIMDQTRNPDPLFSSSTAYVSSLCTIYGLVVTSIVLVFKASTRKFGGDAQSVHFALLAIAGLLLLPASATYHFLLLSLPVALLLRGNDWTIPQWGLAILYCFIGFIPYHFFERFESAGLLTLLAYPRLILMSFLYIFAIMIAWSGPLHFTERINNVRFES